MRANLDTGGHPHGVMFLTFVRTKENLKVQIQACAKGQEK